MTEESRQHYNLTGTDADDASGGAGFNASNQEEMLHEILKQMFGGQHGGMGGGAGDGFPFHGGVNMGGMPFNRAGGSPFFVHLGGMGGPRARRQGGGEQEQGHGGLHGVLNQFSLPYPLKLVPFQVRTACLFRIKLIALEYLFSCIV